MDRREFCRRAGEMAVVGIASYLSGRSSVLNEQRAAVLPAQKLTSTNPESATAAPISTHEQLTQPLDDHYRNTAERIPGTTEIAGPFPENRFRFSQRIKEAGLVPIVFINEDTRERLMKAGDFLGRLYKYLKSNPDQKGPKLIELGINSQDNFPIAFGKDADIITVLESFLSDRMQGRINFSNQPTVGASYLLGTYGEPKYKDGKWDTVANVGINALIIDERALNEENNTSYYQTTDVQLALKLIHEYCHFKQDQALVAEILQDPTQVASIGQDPAKMRNLIAQKARDHQKQVTSRLNLPPAMRDNIFVNEAQANAIAQLVLFTLNQINGSRFPGTEDDSFPIDNNSLYRTYIRTVIQGQPVGQTPRALSLEWQQKHANWGK